MSKVNEQQVRAVVIISADIEWKAFRSLFPALSTGHTPYGEWTTVVMRVGAHEESVAFFQGGWGKIAAAASAQYAIDRWKPDLLINIGTCGGFAGEIERGTVVLAERTIVYDIVEQMLDEEEAVDYYSTDLDLSWLDEAPQDVRRTLLISGDRDLIVEELPELKARYGAAAGDWESGAIAWVAARSGTRCLILRGVTDLVGADGGEAYGNIDLFIENTQAVMETILHHLPAWLGKALRR